MNEFEKNAFVAKARELASKCLAMKLEGMEVFHGLKVNEMAAAYDGIGPEWKWNVIAAVLRHMDAVFEPAAFVQDIQYHVLNDRSEERFHRCNREFYRNCLKCISAEVGWWHPLRRWRLRRSAGVLFRASEDHGMDSWRNRGRATPAGGWRE